MVIVYNLALICIAAGLAADNLMLAFYNGNGISINRRLPRLKKSRLSMNWMVVLVLLFMIENMVLIYGMGFGAITKSLFKNKEKLIAIGILFGMGIRMFHEAKIKNRRCDVTSFNIKLCIETILGTSVYVFAFGCAMAWLKIDHSEVNLLFLPLLILSYLSGIILGKYHFDKTFRYLNIISSLMMIAGSILLTFEQLRTNL
jgi:putative Mn2+ efflux pump MntP